MQRTKSWSYRELKKKTFLKSEQNNPQHVPEVNKNAQKRKRSLMSEVNSSDHDLLHLFTKRPSCAADNEIHEFKCWDSTQMMQTITEVIQSLHDNKRCGHEYGIFYLLWSIIIIIVIGLIICQKTWSKQLS